MSPGRLHTVSGDIRILNWNIGGAKYLELPPHPVPGEQSREEFRKNMNEALRLEIHRRDPQVLTIQEVVEYQAEGRVEKRESVIDPPDDYYYFPHMLIDTLRHSHQGKWNKVRKVGGWPPEAFFAQGNAILVKKDLPHFPLWSLPDLNQDHLSWISQLPRRSGDAPGHGCMEVVALESGLYFGERNTEPRAALVLHLVLSRIGDDELPKPLDVFVVNLHLTTLMLEREGVPAVDERASQIRLRQLDSVLTDVVSRYNEWRAQQYRIRGEHIVIKGCHCQECDLARRLEGEPGPAGHNGGERRETHLRFSPIWIIAGDFNFTPESTEYATLVRRGFVSMVPGRTKAKGLGKDPTLTVDYVFAGPRFEAIDPDRAQKYYEKNQVDVDRDTRVSDHFPQYAQIPVSLEWRG